MSKFGKRYRYVPNTGKMYHTYDLVHTLATTRVRVRSVFTDNIKFTLQVSVKNAR
jgi:hypothetical protein